MDLHQAHVSVSPCLSPSLLIFILTRFVFKNALVCFHQAKERKSYISTQFCSVQQSTQGIGQSVSDCFRNRADQLEEWFKDTYVETLEHAVSREIFSHMVNTCSWYTIAEGVWVESGDE